MPNNAFKEFDLSPVIIIENKKARNNKDKGKYNFLLFLKIKSRCPQIIKIKPFIQAPAIGSSLKKLTILSPKSPPQPKILAPENFSK